MKLDRADVTRWLPARVKQRLRPYVVGSLYRLEQPRLRRLYGTFVSPGELVFDVGAAEGYHTEVFLDLGATVVCLEPQPHFAEVLRRRFADRPDVTVLEQAAGPRADRLPLSISTGDPEISTLDVEKWSRGRYRGRTWDRSVVVPVVTLDEVAAEHGHPSFVKIDVEGYEAGVLEGLRGLPPALSFELTCELLADVAACVAVLEQRGAPRFNYSLSRRHRLESSRWLSGAELLDELRAFAGRHRSGDVYARFS